MLRLISTLSLMLLQCGISHAELADLSESELSDVSGEGIGLVYENYQMNMQSEVMGGEVGNDFKITGIKDSSAQDVTVRIGQFYLAGSGTNLGTDLVGKPVNLGRLSNPITIDLLDGNTLGGGAYADKSVLAIAMPTKFSGDGADLSTNTNGYSCVDSSLGANSGLCSSRPNNADGNGFHGERFDMGYKINREFTHVDTSKDVNLNFHAQAANMDGSFWRFWGSDASDGVDVDGGVASSDSGLMMEAQINFYADKLVFNSCDLDGATSCGEQVGFEEFSMELALGSAKYFQPLTIDVSDSGFLHIQIQALPKPGDARLPGTTKLIGADGLVGTSDAVTHAWYKDYYENGPKTNISIGNVTVGPAGAPESFGSASIQGMQIQYLEVISHEL